MHRHTTQKSGRRLKERRPVNFTTSFQRLRCPEVVCVCVCMRSCTYFVCTCMPAVNTVCRAAARARASYTVLTLSSVKFVSIFHDHSDSNLPRPVSLCPRGLGFHFGVRPIPRAFDVSSPSSRSPPLPSSTSRPISLSPPSSPFLPCSSRLSQRRNVYLFSLSPAVWSPRITFRERREPRRRL